MSVDYPPPHATYPSPRAGALVGLAAAAGVGLVAGTVAALTAPWQTTPLLGWDAAALTWVMIVWVRIRRLDAVATSAHATRDDPQRATADALLLVASVASLVGVVLGIIKAGSAHGDQRAFLFAWGIVTVVVSWAVVHTVYTLRYAGLYYAGPDGGVDFNEDDKPCYVDFAYLAFTIGMTYQVSDTNLTTKAIRHTALRHALLSYIFGTIIIAATINLAAGLVK
jgi:uncharacterized membrane protein